MIKTSFTKIIDELVQEAQYDPELAVAIKWLDEQAQKKGVSFYAIVFELLYTNDANSRAKQWMYDRK